jgi:hypothetical protein
MKDEEGERKTKKILGKRPDDVSGDSATHAQTVFPTGTVV